ncbi:hypothetical protein [Streptomyces sp. NRRL WC-3742]|nr:hypothetical protein [Streptomyces sp. NRRL WC-3742]
MSGTIPPERQGKWRAQRRPASRGPNRVPAHPPMPVPLPDEEPEPETTD